MVGTCLIFTEIDDMKVVFSQLLLRNNSEVYSLHKLNTNSYIDTENVSMNQEWMLITGFT